jgi:hypothetical protein
LEINSMIVRMDDCIQNGLNEVMSLQSGLSFHEPLLE